MAGENEEGQLGDRERELGDSLPQTMNVETPERFMR